VAELKEQIEIKDRRISNLQTQVRCQSEKIMIKYLAHYINQ
jgi:hypothetical protein